MMGIFFHNFQSKKSISSFMFSVPGMFNPFPGFVRSSQYPGWWCNPYQCPPQRRCVPRTPTWRVPCPAPIVCPQNPMPSPTPYPIHGVTSMPSMPSIPGRPTAPPGYKIPEPCPGGGRCHGGCRNCTPWSKCSDSWGGKGRPNQPPIPIWGE